MFILQKEREKESKLIFQNHFMQHFQNFAGDFFAVKKTNCNNKSKFVHQKKAKRNIPDKATFSSLIRQKSG